VFGGAVLALVYLRSAREHIKAGGLLLLLGLLLEAHSRRVCKRVLALAAHEAGNHGCGLEGLWGQHLVVRVVDTHFVARDEHGFLR
jgi:hypothetical protein